MPRATLLLAILLLAPPAAAEPWPSAHATPNNQREAPSNVTRATLANLSVAWRVPTRGAVTGTPVHDGRVAYFADWGGIVRAIWLSNGTPVWQVDHHARVDASLAIAGGRVLVPDATGNLTALDQGTGALLWETWVEPLRGVHLWGSPTVVADRVYIGIASEQTDLDYIGAQDFRGGVACLDLATGDILWKTYVQDEGAHGVSVWSTPAVDSELGMLYVGTGNAYGPPAGKLSDSLVALRTSDGSVAWSYQSTAGDTFDARGSPGPDADVGASPLLFDVGERHVVADGDKGGRFFALDRTTGELLWRTTVDFIAPGASPSEKEGFLGTAAYANGVIYAPTTARSMVHALDAATGKVLWAKEMNPTPQSYGERMFGPTSVTNGIVIQGSAFGAVHFLDAATGDELRALPIGADVQGGISIAPDMLLVPDAGSEVWGPTGNVTAYRIQASATKPPTPSTTPTTLPSTPTLPPFTVTPTSPPALTTVVIEAPTPSAKISRAPGPDVALLILGLGLAATCRARSRR